MHIRLAFSYIAPGISWCHHVVSVVISAEQRLVHSTMKPILLVIALQLAATSYVAMCSPVVSDECGRLSRRAAPLRPPVDDTQKSDCVAFNYTYCNDMGHSNGWGSYSYASFPNGRQQTQPQCAIDEIADFNTLLQSTDQCSTKLGTLLCFYYFPWCDPNTVMADSYGKLVHLHVLPCRSVCEEVRRDCRASLEALGQTWPRHLNCSDTRIFPIPGAGGLGSPIQCTTGSQLTTTDDPSASSDSPSVTPVTPTNPIGTREPEGEVSHNNETTTWGLVVLTTIIVEISMVKEIG